MVRSKKNKIVLNNRNLIAQINPKSVSAEEYRNIRTNIEFSSFDFEMQSLIVTSANPSEGKSTTAANLAVVFAQHGKKVLLVDTDLRKPTVHYTFQLNNYRGLTNLLSNQAELPDLINKSSEENLYVLPSGPTPPNPSKLLSSKNMDKFLEEANQYFDMVILDTPPIIPVADAKVLMKKVSGVVLVVRSGQTEKDSAKKAIESILQAKGNLLGLVLNDKKQTKVTYYSAYGEE